MTRTNISSRKFQLVAIACGVLGVGLLVAAQPLLLWYRLAPARQAIADRNPEIAIQCLEAFTKKYGSNADASFLMARAFRHQEAYAQGLAALKEAHSLGYPVQALERERLLSLAESGQMAPDDAELQALVSSPGNDASEVYEALVKGYYRLYELGPASLVLDVWQETYPDDAQPLIYRGLLCEHDEQWNEASQYFRRAVMLAPKNPDCHRHLAHSEQKQYHYRQATHHYRVALQRRDEVESLIGLGNCLADLGEFEEARSVFAHGLELSPNRYELLLALGELDVDAGRGPDALRWLEPAVRLKPREYDARYGLAKALLFAGRGDEAKPHFQFAALARQELSRVSVLRKYVASHSDDAEVRYEIGKVLAQYGDPQEAFKWLNSVLKYAPSHQRARDAITDLNSIR